MQAGERQPSRSGEPGVRAGVADRAGVQSELPSPAGAPGNRAFPQSHWGNSPAPCAYHVQGPQWASTGHPGRAVHVRHPPPNTVCVQYSSPGRTPPRSSHLKGLRASFPSLPSSVSATLQSPRLMIPASKRHRPVFSAAQANATALSSRVPVQHTPPGGGSHSLCLETRPEPCLAVLAALPLSQVPAAAPRPRTALDSDHSRPTTGLPRALQGLTSLTVKAAPEQRPPGPHDGPPCPPCLGGQRGSSLGPCPRPSHETRLPTPPPSLPHLFLRMGHCPKCFVSHLFTLSPASPAGLQAP